MFRTKVLVLLAVLAVACGTAQGVERPLSGDVVLLATPSGIGALSVRTGRIERRITEGIVGPDGQIVSTSFDGNSTQVIRTAPRGKVLAHGRVEGDVVGRVVTDELIALADRAGAGDTKYLSVPKARTRIVVLDDDGRQREFMLDGNFEPEAFKVDGSELFMIEYIPALAPDRYRVRRLKLESGAVMPIGRLKQNAPGQMQGTGRNQVMAPYGDELYTLYTQQIDPGHEDEGHGADVAHAFVHVLNLDQGWAHCIDLPSIFASGPATAGAIAVNPYGSRVYVGDWTQGVVALLNPRRVRLVRTVTDLDLGTEDDETFAAASNDRLYMAGNDSVVVLDARSFEILDRWDLAAEVTGLRLVDARLFVSTTDSVEMMDAASGRVLRSISVVGATGIEGVVLDV
jgi:hypothetical protein